MTPLTDYMYIYSCMMAVLLGGLQWDLTGCVCLEANVLEQINGDGTTTTSKHLDWPYLALRVVGRSIPMTLRSRDKRQVIQCSM